MARRRRRRGLQLWGLVILVAIAGAGYWWWSFRPAPSTEPTEVPRVALSTDRPESVPADGGPYANVPERGSTPEDTASSRKQDPDRGMALLASAKKALQASDLIAARAQLSEALQYELPLNVKVQVRADLTQIAQETLFSNAIVDGDPFTEAYVVKSGDTLGKIAKKYDVTSDLLASINGLRNKNVIRVGQRLKAIKGPFRAVVTKDEYALDVYLKDTFVRRYPVGLGAENSTPSGTWKVENKLVNPQYYPPRGGDIIMADDPENPLGERWIGLEGIAGGAVQQERYGIHGTIEPESIGQNASLGCIRMHNQDVEEFYDLVVVNDSRVIVQ